jgi:hypothetical protein
MPTHDKGVEACMTLTYRNGFIATVSGNEYLCAMDIAQVIKDLGFGIELSFV